MQFKPDIYFDLSLFPFNEIFHNVRWVWEAVARISKISRNKLIKGNNCTISSSAYIREGVILGNNVYIGHCVELKNCIVMSNTHVAHLNYVGDSIIGNNVNVAGGTVFANLRLDKKKVYIKTKKNKIQTHLSKFSSIIGDNCSIGANCVLNPGTIIGKNSIVYPLTSVVGIYPEQSVIK